MELFRFVYFILRICFLNNWYTSILTLILSTINVTIFWPNVSIGELTLGLPNKMNPSVVSNCYIFEIKLCCGWKRRGAATVWILKGSPTNKAWKVIIFSLLPIFIHGVYKLKTLFTLKYLWIFCKWVNAFLNLLKYYWLINIFFLTFMLLHK